MAQRVANASNVSILEWNPYQDAFLKARRTRNEKGYHLYHRMSLIAGRRGGKTHIGALSAIEEASVPNTVGWCCAPSYPQLHDYVMPAFFQQIPQSWVEKGKWSEEHKELRLPNNSVVQFRSLDNPERGRGPGLHWVWLDEASQIQEKAWDYLAPALTEHRGIAWFTTTPRGFDWVYHRLYIPATDQRPGYWACKFRTIDNPTIPKSEVREAQETMSEALFRQEYLADFVHFQGAIFGDLINDNILNSDEEVKEYIPEWPRIDPSRPRLIGLDPGADHPFAGVFLVSTPNGMVQVDEYLERNLTIARHVVNIRKKVPTGQQNIRWAYDRSQRQTGIELSAHGIYVQPAENKVDAGISRVESWLAAKQFKIIASRCPKTLQEFRAYRWADNTTKDGEIKPQRPYKKNDDLMDALRYALMLWPQLPKPDTKKPSRDPKTIPPDSLWRYERMQRIEAAEAQDGLTPIDDEPYDNDFYR